MSTSLASSLLCAPHQKNNCGHMSRTHSSSCVAKRMRVIVFRCRQAAPLHLGAALCCRVVQRNRAHDTASTSGGCVQVCNHRFHNECLQKWGDSSCPVCRYSVSSNHDSSCQVCAAKVDLWMCLLCGHVGCGRYQAAHARDHYTATDHCYSLEVTTGRVCHAACPTQTALQSRPFSSSFGDLQRSAPSLEA
jgi:hypothetical protein